MSQFETSAGYLGYPFENGASKMAVSVRFLCHLPNEEMAIHFSSTISCLIVERISQVASTGASLSCMSQHLVPFSAALLHKPREAPRLSMREIGKLVLR